MCDRLAGRSVAAAGESNVILECATSSQFTCTFTYHLTSVVLCTTIILAFLAIGIILWLHDGWLTTMTPPTCCFM